MTILHTPTVLCLNSSKFQPRVSSPYEKFRRSCEFCDNLDNFTVYINDSRGYRGTTCIGVIYDKGLIKLLLIHPVFYSISASAN